MHVGVLRETKPEEGRVALSPTGAAALVAKGHRVFVEAGAGEQAGYGDAHFEASGAVPAQKGDVLAQAHLLLKVKAPLPAEYGDYRREQVLLTFFHFDENIPGEEIGRMIAGGFLGIACEAIACDGRWPILEPMSRLTGYLFAQRALDLCMIHKGVFGARLEEWLPARRAVLIGAGQIGLSVLRFYRALRLPLTVLANAGRAAVNALANERFGTTGRDYLPDGEVSFLQMDVDSPERTQAALQQALEQSDILINAAVRRGSLPRARLPHLVTRPMLGVMAPGSVVCDATACDRDLVETCVSSPFLQRIDLIDGLIHYSPDHIPSLVARTATDLFSAASLPFVLELAEGGIGGALNRRPSLRNAVVCGDGVLTQAGAAAAKGLPVVSVDTVLRARSAA